MGLASAVEVEGVWKFFGERAALRGVSFRVGEGEVFGLIGPNGAGKTTCFRILATVLKPSRGFARIFGFDVREDAQEVRRVISYLPEEAGVYRSLSGAEYIRFLARVYSRDEEESLREAEEISGLGDALRARMSSYSLGMRRRILLAGTLIARPRLAILDEPTSGLDVMHAVYVRDVIRKYSRQGMTFLVSSHNMLEVEYLCDRIAFIDGGVIIAEGEPRSLMESAGAENLEELFLSLRGAR
ncbi:MAG: ABC transporter ATP-binding protein [Nitrososphaerota archaeon]